MAVMDSVHMVLIPELLAHFQARLDIQELSVIPDTSSRTNGARVQVRLPRVFLIN